MRLPKKRKTGKLQPYQNKTQKTAGLFFEPVFKLRIAFQLLHLSFKR